MHYSGPLEYLPRREYCPPRSLAFFKNRVIDTSMSFVVAEANNRKAVSERRSTAIEWQITKVIS